MAANDEHVILFPFTAQGHVAPFRCLAELVRCARPDVRITMVATPSVAESLRASLAAGDVDVHELPFNPAEHGLPTGGDDSSANLTGSQQRITTLLIASESLRPAFHRFVADLRAANPGADLHIMADMFMGWTVDVAGDDDARVSHSIVLTCGAYGAALCFSLWNSVPLLPANDDGDTFVVVPHEFPDMSVQRSQLADQLATADGKDARSIFIRKQVASFSRADALLVNTTEALEPKGLSMLRQWFSSVPTYPVGPLLLRTTTTVSEARDRTTILAWLDKQLPGSVLYVSFGSQCTINTSQMVALASGLAHSAHKFVWVVRPLSGLDDVNGHFRPEWLPEGFEEKVAATGQGLVVRGWAPQLEILAHPATGAFLTHCGWNSVQESLANGVPLIGWPLSADQFYNAKMLVEVGVCVEVARGSDAVGRDKITEVVDTVLGETSERAVMRSKAAEMKKVIRDGAGSSVKVVERFFAVVSRRHHVLPSP